MSQHGIDVIALFVNDGRRVNSVLHRIKPRSNHSRERINYGFDLNPESFSPAVVIKKGNMKKLPIALFTISLTAAMSASAQIYVLGPSDAVNGALSNGSAPIDTTSSQAMIGTGAWQANGTAASQYYLYYNGSSSTEDGLGQLTINDLNSLSFSTYETAAEENAGDPSANWYLLIYTAKYTGGEASWYGNALVMEPYLANGYNPALNTWVTWSTTAGNNQLTLGDYGSLGLNTSGVYGQPTLANVQSGPITWHSIYSGGNSTPISYGSQDILGIVLCTGSGWAAGFTGLVDDVNIDTTQGNAQFDLEPVPEPTTMTMLAGALLLLPFSLRMLRKNRTA